jgi:hypothetical protein
MNPNVRKPCSRGRHPKSKTRRPQGNKGTTNSLADNGETGNELKEEGIYNAHSVAKGLPGMKVAFDRLLSASSVMFSCSVSAVVVPSFTRVLPAGEFFSSP